MENMTALPGVKKHMLNSDFWIKKIKDSDKAIMHKDQIIEFNKSTFSKVKAMCNLSEYKERLSKEELIGIIESYMLPETTRYNIKGEKTQKNFYDKIISNTNIDKIKEINEVKFGIAIINTRVRSFPTDEGSFDSMDDIEFDLFQETECQAIEPVAILHTSRDNDWFFIQMYNYNGWVKKNDIAIGNNRKEILDYCNTDKFLIVTGNKISTQLNHYDSRISQNIFYMGTKIPLESNNITEAYNQTTVFNYVVKLPVKDIDGKLDFKNALISFMEDVNYGYLTYTRENILRQAFKLQGDRYDWGNNHNGRDCSSFVMYVYKTCGIILPRNADQQEMGEGIFYKINENASIYERNILFNKIVPGALIFMDGHVMLYIGEDNGEHFMIHDFYRYGTFDGETIKPVYVNEVAVTSTLMLTAKGKKFIETFIALGQYETSNSK
jgi:hypothetical protein